MVKGGMEAFWITLPGQHVSEEPVTEVSTILFGGFSEAEPHTNVGPVQFDGAPLPVIPLKTLRRDVDLVRNMSNDRLWDVTFEGGEVPFVLESFEQEGKTQSRGVSATI